MQQYFLLVSQEEIKEIPNTLRAIKEYFSGDKNKVFSKSLNRRKTVKIKYVIHQSHVNCITKEKEAKKYEFGNKSSIQFRQ